LRESSRYLVERLPAVAVAALPHALVALVHIGHRLLEQMSAGGVGWGVGGWVAERGGRERRVREKDSGDEVKG
jgi:hypothetical protein